MTRDGSGRTPDDARDADRLPASARMALRSLYAAPGDPTYWEDLEARVMSRVRTGRLAAADDWTGVLVGWARRGAAVAAAAALVAGAALLAARRETERAQARAVAVLVNEPAAVPAVAATGPDEGRSREATLQYLIAR